MANENIPSHKWEVEAVNGMLFVEYRGPNNEGEPTVCHLGKDNPVNRKRAALIEAAPVMYEALNAAYAALQECVPFPHHPDPGAIEDIKAQIREALAAANPETPKP